MALITAVIVLVWMLLLGTVYGGRRADLPPWTLVVLVTSIYAALAAGSIIVLGSDRQGWFGAAGMLFPYSISLIVALSPRRKH